MASIPAFSSTTRKPTLMRSLECLMDAKHVGQRLQTGLHIFKCHPSACWNYVGQENGQGLLVLGISDDVVEGHAGSAATHHDAAQNLCLAFTS